jgi:hypothetical protein
MLMKFVIENVENGMVGFTIRTGDDQVLATGRPCLDKGSALAAIGELMQDLSHAGIEDRTEQTSTVVSGGEDMADIGRSGIPPV